MKYVLIHGQPYYRELVCVAFEQFKQLASIRITLCWLRFFEVHVCISSVENQFERARIRGIRSYIGNKTDPIVIIVHVRSIYPDLTYRKIGLIMIDLSIPETIPQDWLGSTYRISCKNLSSMKIGRSTIGFNALSQMS